MTHKFSFPTGICISRLAFVFPVWYCHFPSGINANFQTRVSRAFGVPLFSLIELLIEFLIEFLLRNHDLRILKKMTIQRYPFRQSDVMFMINEGDRYEIEY